MEASAWPRAWDLAALTTFQTGSAGGGGSADYTSQGISVGPRAGAGRGERSSSRHLRRVTITGTLLANGGAGGDAFVATNCTSGAAGGGGSGGVIYLSAPSISVSSSATISALGGAGGAKSSYATGGAGGAGGLGRIRLSVAQATCSITGTLRPPLGAAGCVPLTTGTAGAVYVGAYPN